MTPLFIGVDGGLSGAIAALDGETLRLYDIPSKIRRVNRKDKSEVDQDLLLALLACEIVGVPDVRVLIEAGVGDRRQSSAASYNYGFTNGTVWMAVRSLTSNAERIYPTVWKRHFLLIGKDKSASRRKADRLFPGRHLFDLEGDHNKAEAALIAVYAKQVKEKP